MAALIPFAVDKETGAIREVGDVPRGRKCGCICPSCKAGLVARQGGENEWHFAHDYRADDRPDRKCDISFESACRLFVIDLLKEGRIPLIKTPAFGNVAVGGAARMRPGTSLVGLTFVDSQEYGDVKAEIGGYVLEIFMDYQARVPPEAPENPETTGLLAFPVALVRRRYQKVKGGPHVLAGIVASIFDEDDGGKSWLFHPAMRHVQPADAYKGEMVVGSVSALPEQAHTGVIRNPGSPDLIRRPHYPNSDGVRPIPRRPEPRRVDSEGSYKCYRCDNTWVGGEVSGRRCPQCGSDKHSVFRPC